MESIEMAAEERGSPTFKPGRPSSTASALCSLPCPSQRLQVGMEGWGTIEDGQQCCSNAA